MTGIYICSTMPKAGKSLLSFSLGVMLQQRGYKIGYMKPVGRASQKVEEISGDSDALVVQEILGQKVSPDLLTPLFIPENPHALALFEESPDKVDYLSNIAASYSKISEGNEVMLVSGTGSFPLVGHFGNADGMSILRRLKLRALFIERFDGQINYDSLLYMKSILGNNMLGVVLNDVPPRAMHDAVNLLAPYLSSKGVKVHGVIPREHSLADIRVADLARALSGTIVAGNANASRMINGFLIGTMQVDNFMGYLRQNTDRAVIVGGDRVDLQFAALHSQSPCIILTSNIRPCDLVRSKAEKQGTPLITVCEDAYTVTRAMTRIFKNKKLKDLHQIRLGINLLENSVSISSILESLGLPVDKCN